MSFVSTDKYIKIPSVTTTQRNALTAVNGMVVYDTDLNLFYKYENGSWSSFAGGGGSYSRTVVSTNTTAANDTDYTLVASATFTDPTPAEGKGYSVLVRNGTATIGGSTYNTAGQLIWRVYHSGSWTTYQLVTQTQLNAKQDSLGFTPEDVTNKTDVMSGNTTSSTKYLSAKGVYDWVIGLGYQVALTAANFGAFINGLSAKTTPVDADAFSLIDSEDSNNAKKLTWANIKATLKTYFDELYSSPIYSPTAGNAIAEIIDDFAYVTPLSGSYSSHAMVHSGSNITSITNLISTMTNQLGVVSCQYNGVGDNVWSMARVAALGQGELCFGCYMSRPNDSGAANQSNLRFGLRLGAGDGTDGVFFKLNEATNGNQWQCITRASSVSTTSNTSVTTAKSSWVRLFIVVNAAGTEAKFYIDGTLVATHNTNMPAAGTALTGILNMERTVISSVITWLIDYFYIKQTFTTPR